jgi:hypothetical protein
MGAKIIASNSVRRRRVLRGPIVIGVLLGAVAYFAFDTLSARSAEADPPAVAEAPRQQRFTQAPVRQASSIAAPQRLAPSTSLGFGYRNCAEARAAGADPVYAGEPGYGEHLDRDRDGIGCEPYPR